MKVDLIAISEYAASSLREAQLVLYGRASFETALAVHRG